LRKETRLFSENRKICEGLYYFATIPGDFIVSGADFLPLGKESLT
jgi:hypothetical protein